MFEQTVGRDRKQRGLRGCIIAKTDFEDVARPYTVNCGEIDLVRSFWRRRSSGSLQRRHRTILDTRSICIEWVLISPAGLTFQHQSRMSETIRAFLIFGFQRESALQTFNGSVPLMQIGIGVAQTKVGISVVGIQMDRPLEISGRFIELARLAVLHPFFVKSPGFGASFRGWPLTIGHFGYGRRCLRAPGTDRTLRLGLNVCRSKP